MPLMGRIFSCLVPANKIKSNTRPTESKNRLRGAEDVNAKDCWEKIEHVANTILKNRETLDQCSWKDAIYDAYGLSMNGALFEVALKIESIIKKNVTLIEQNLAHEKLLENYLNAWRYYKVASKDFQELFLHYNKIVIDCNKNRLQAFEYLGIERYRDIDNITNSAWKNNMLEPIGCEITSLLWNAIKNEENEVTIVQVVQSFEQVDAVDLFEKLFFDKLEEYFKSKTSEWFQGLNVSQFIENVLQKMEKEVEWGQKFLPKRSIDKMRSIFIEKATAERMDEMMMEWQQMFKENRKDELKNLYKILDLLPAERFGQGRLSATLRIAAQYEALNSSYLNMEEFEANLLSIYKKYSALITELFSGNFSCTCGLQKALEYDCPNNRCDGTKMLEECMKEMCSSENLPTESALKASALLHSLA